jgi:hypothetical protein
MKNRPILYAYFRRNGGEAMRNNAIRIAIWASVGFLISAGWGFYFATANKAIPIGPIVYFLARLTEPVAAVVSYFNFPVGLSAIAVANAATYALMGILLTAIRRHYWPLQI